MKTNPCLRLVLLLICTLTTILLTSDRPWSRAMNMSGPTEVSQQQIFVKSESGIGIAGELELPSQ